MSSFFPYAPDWSSGFSVRLNKPIDFHTAENGQEQSTQVAQENDFITTMDTSYVVFSSAMLRSLEAALSDTPDGSHLIPFYPEPLTSPIDMKGAITWAGDSPDHENVVFGPAATGDLTLAVYATVPITMFSIRVPWYLTRLDRLDWSNSETIQVLAWADIGGTLSYLMASPFVKTIPLENQQFFWTAPMLQKGPVAVSAITDTHSSVKVTWER